MRTGPYTAELRLGQGLEFVIPVGPRLAFVAVAVLAGMLAPIAPARRASRLAPLTALAYE